MGRGLGQQAPTCRAELTELFISSSELWWSSPGLCRAGSTSVGVAEWREADFPVRARKKSCLAKNFSHKAVGFESCPGISFSQTGFSQKYY